MAIAQNFGSYHFFVHPLDFVVDGTIPRCFAINANDSQASFLRGTGYVEVGMTWVDQSSDIASMHNTGVSAEAQQNAAARKAHSASAKQAIAALGSLLSSSAREVGPNCTVYNYMCFGMTESLTPSPTPSQPAQTYARPSCCTSKLMHRCRTLEATSWWWSWKQRLVL